SFKLFVERNINEKDNFYRLLFFPLVYGVAYSISSIFVVLKVFENFFRPFDIYWSINFAHWAVESSHNFYTIFKNSLRIAASITIGAIVSYISLSMVGRSVWPNCFIFLVYTFLATDYYSPIVHLKFVLASFISIGTCTLTCIIFRMNFGSGLFIKTTVNIFDEIRSYIRLSQKQINLIMHINNDFYIIHKHYKNKLDFHYYEYSNQLNQLNLYLNDSRKECFGMENLVYHYEKIQILLERNHKKLYAIGFGLRQDCTLSVSSKLLPILPLLNQLISETENIFNTMEKQLQKKYAHSDNHTYRKWFKEQHEKHINNPEEYEKECDKIDLRDSNIPFKVNQLEIVLNISDKSNFKPNSLEWQQNEINKAFNRIEKIIEEMEQTFTTIFYEKTLFNPHEDNSLSKIFYSMAGFKSFSLEQKFLSKEVFLVSYHLSLKRFRPREFRFLANFFKNIKHWFLNFKKNRRIQRNSMDQDLAHPINLNKKQLIISNFKGFVMNRILFNWFYSLKYSLVIGILSVVIYEIQKHSDFILFDRLAWLLDTFILVCQPDLGAIAFVSSMRIIGTMIGGFMAFACVVLCKLGQSNAAAAFIYIGYSFFTITLCAFLIQGQPFDTMLQIIIFTYSVISVPQFFARQEDIIFALFKILYVTLGVILVLIVAIIVPYFDFRQLEKNLYRIPKAIVEMVDFLMEYSFNEKEMVKMDENQDESLINANPLETINNNNNNINNNINNNNNNKPISFRNYRILIGKKYIKLRTIFPAQRRLLIDSGFELIFQYKKYQKINHILKSIEELHNLFGALEFMIIQSNDQSKMRSIGSRVKDENRLLMDDLQHTSDLLSQLPPEKDNIGFTKRISSKLQLSVTQDHSIELCDKLIIHLNRVLVQDYSKLSVLQFHRINAILFSLYCFVDEYHNVFNSLVSYKNIIVINKLNNNNYRNTSNEKDLKEQLNILN
ncbi:hypothetical protein DICPUDRAFT_27918, partial [Dictyostelium purpureum]